MNDLIEIGPVREGTSNTLRVHAPVGMDLSNKTVYVYLVNATGAAIQVGSTAVGAGFNPANDDVDVTVDWKTSGLGGGVAFSVEVVADPDSSNRMVISVDEYMVTIKQAQSFISPSS